MTGAGQGFHYGVRESTKIVQMHIYNIFKNTPFFTIHL